MLRRFAILLLSALPIALVLLSPGSTIQAGYEWMGRMDLPTYSLESTIGADSLINPAFVSNDADTVLVATDLYHYPDQEVVLDVMTGVTQLTPSTQTLFRVSHTNYNSAIFYAAAISGDGTTIAAIWEPFVDADTVPTLHIFKRDGDGVFQPHQQLPVTAFQYSADCMGTRGIGSMLDVDLDGDVIAMVYANYATGQAEVLIFESDINDQYSLNHTLAHSALVYEDCTSNFWGIDAPMLADDGNSVVSIAAVYIPDYVADVTLYIREPSSGLFSSQLVASDSFASLIWADQNTVIALHNADFLALTRNVMVMERQPDDTFDVTQYVEAQVSGYIGQGTPNGDTIILSHPEARDRRGEVLIYERNPQGDYEFVTSVTDPNTTALSILNEMASYLGRSGVFMAEDGSQIFAVYRDWSIQVGQPPPRLSVFSHTPPLPVPTNLTATPAAQTQINLSWDAVAEAETYTVERTVAGGADWSAIANGLTTTTYSDSTLTCGNSYEYRVRSVTTDQQSLSSATATASTDICPTPTLVPTHTPSLTPTATPSPTYTLTPSPTLEPTATPQPTDTLDGGAFEGDLSAWTLTSKGTRGGDKIRCNNTDRPNGKPDKIFSYSGDCAFRFRGGAGEVAKLKQSVDLTNITPQIGDTVTLSAYVNAPKANARLKVKLIVTYDDDTPKGKFTTNIAAPTDGYQPLNGSVTLASAAVSKVKVLFIHRSPSGKVYLDDIALTWTQSAPLPLPPVQN